MLNVKRYPGNPILKPRPELLWRGSARNPGVVYDGQKFHMLFTADSKPSDGIIRLGYAGSTDGYNFEENDEPCFDGNLKPGTFDHAGCEDARITYLEGQYVIAYAGRAINMRDYAFGARFAGPNGNLNPTWFDNYRRVGLATTKDFKTFEKLGPITSEHISDANVAFFPEKINGKYAMLHRPTAFIP